MSDTEDLKKLIDSFIAYRSVLTPLQESLRAVGETYEAIRNDLDSLTRSLSGNAAGQLDKIASVINAQAKSGQELSKRIDEFAVSEERYTQAVNRLTNKLSEVSKRIEAADQIERQAEELIGKLDDIVSEKRQNYNLKDLQRALEGYNKNVEKVSDFINKDVGQVLSDNAEKIDAIKRENEALVEAVSEQGKSIAQLSATFAETSTLLKKVVEGGSVNEEYLFDAFDKWAADRKVKIKKK